MDAGMEARAGVDGGRAEEPASLLRAAADRVEDLAARTAGGRWSTAGLLASRPEVIAHQGEGTEHVAEARARTAAWITTLSPAVARPLVGWLRATAAAQEDEDAPRPDDRLEAALDLARALLVAG